MVSIPEQDKTEATIEPPWWRPGKASRRRNPLSREHIVEAALRIVDAEGVDALTVRRLGDELNTGSATIYWYVSGKDELSELVYDHVMGGIALPDPDPTRWQEQLKDMGRQQYRLLLQHNDLVRLSVGRIPVGPNMLHVMEWFVGLLRGAGLPDDAVEFAGDIFGRYIDASVLEVTAQGGPPPELVGQYFASLPPDRFPNMTALHRNRAGRDDDARFEFGLDVLVRGFAAFVNGKTEVGN
jgi:AcrR family transcriptional regulator